MNKIKIRIIIFYKGYKNLELIYFRGYIVVDWFSEDKNDKNNAK